MKKTKFDKNVQILTYKPNTCLNSSERGGRKPQQLIFQIYIPNSAPRPIFSFEIVLTVRNKLIMTLGYREIHR